MGAVYGRLVMAGTRTLESVPKLWRAKTEAWLEEQGWETPSGDGGEE